MSLAALIADPHAVLAQWPREPQLFHRNPAAFADLLTLDEVNTLIDAECVAMRNVVLIKDGKILERHTYDGGDMPRPGAVRRHLDEGGTISLRQLHTLKPPLSHVQRGIQRDTGCVVHVNAYLTPPRNQGLKYHYDPYVTLIVQLAGRKTWPLHRPFVVNPVTEHLNFLTRGFTYEERKLLASSPPERSMTLEPGDVFWLPRGWVHSPYTEGEETSLHLTFALKERTYHWLAEQVTRNILDQALEDPAMRAGIQPTELGASLSARFIREYLVGTLLLLDDQHVSALAYQAVHG
ncbi:JmjC domain-containing protein [Streptomyces sp. NPDC002851]